MRGDWTVGDIPDLEGRTAIVTGASGGVGYQIALQLSLHRAHVVLASRDWERTEQARRRIQASSSNPHVESMRLDLADLSTIRAFSRDFSARHGGADILVNNAGVSGGPRRETKDGLETIFQVNYLGHFAPTGLLLPALRARQGARVVTMSSDIASRGRIDFDDLHAKRRYGLVSTYAQSKLANLAFAIELDRRARQAGLSLSSLMTNPGVAKTDLFAARTQEWGRSLTFGERMLKLVQGLLGRSAEEGAVPALYQATEPRADRSQYIGGAKWPKPFGLVVEQIPKLALDRALATRLWDVSEDLAGVRFDGI
jgi:NAD(P)-dependent dehydrogenase (short-subunit alcohol dehydrogenase family)